MDRPPTPVDVRWNGARAVIEWCNFRDLAFTDPFFTHTFFRLRERYPESRTWETGIDRLLEQAAEGGGLEPSGFIFHMSRCGSTLVSRLLGSSPQVLSLGEPDPVLGMLEYPASVGLPHRRDWLRALILALGRPRRPSEHHYIIKLTSFCLFHAPLIREVFPRTPWVFVFRDPSAVMRSILARPTGFMRMQATPEEAARYLEVPPAAIAAMPQEEYLARFLARMCDFMLAQGSQTDDDNVRFIAYEWLPEATWKDVVPLFGIRLSSVEKARMEDLAAIYSKDPTSTVRFRPVAADWDTPTADQARQAARTWLNEAYGRLRTEASVLRGE